MHLSIKTILFVLFLFIFGSTAYANSPPVIDQLDVVLLDGKVHVTLNWRSDAPVTEINISGGKDVQVVKDKINTFRTSIGGYKGRHSQVVDSNYVMVQKTYRTEHLSSQYVRQGTSVAASMDASRTNEPLQEVIVITAWLIDKYGNMSERKEHRISKNIETAPSLNPGQNQPGGSGTSSDGGGQPMTWEGILTSFAVDTLRRPRVFFNSVVPSADGNIAITASAVSGNNFTQFACKLIDPATNNIRQETMFECSAAVCKNKSVNMAGVSPGSYRLQIIAVDSSSQEAKAIYNSLVTVPAANTQPSQPSQPAQPAQPVAGASSQPSTTSTDDSAPTGLLTP